MFYGRDLEFKELERRYRLKESQLVVIYGRRRIGKTALLESFKDNKKNLWFDGVENQNTEFQISKFLNDFSKQTNDPMSAKLQLSGWIDALELLTKYIQSQKTKTVLILDEFQWLACGQTKLVSLIKSYWDNHWKQKNTMLIICGSVAHYIFKKVVRSKALYGRINWELQLSDLPPVETRKFVSKRSPYEALKYMLIFGGVPKYFEEIDQKTSFKENINDLFFKKNSFFVNEIDKVFYSQFRESQNYKKIILCLSKKNMSLSELAASLKIPSGGGFKSYLDNLEKAGFIRNYVSQGATGRRNVKYKLFDPYLNFYFKFVDQHQRLIQQNEKQNLFTSLVEKKWTPWLGIAFEVFCLRNAYLIAEIAGFAADVISMAPYFSAKDEKFQIDLIFTRADNILTVCEIKFYDKPVGTDIIPEVKRKLLLLPKTKKDTVETMLISPFGADKSLRSSEFFDHIIEFDDFLKK